MATLDALATSFARTQRAEGKARETIVSHISDITLRIRAR